ncbi:MAG: hypothetical protein WC560_10380 [Syntrophales bacterium]
MEESELRETFLDIITAEDSGTRYDLKWWIAIPLKRTLVKKQETPQKDKKISKIMGRKCDIF